MVACVQHTTGTSGLVISAAGHKDMRWVTGRRKESSNYWGGASVRRALLHQNLILAFFLCPLIQCSLSLEGWVDIDVPIWG